MSEPWSVKLSRGEVAIRVCAADGSPLRVLDRPIRTFSKAGEAVELVEMSDEAGRCRIQIEVIEARAK